LRNPLLEFEPPVFVLRFAVFATGIVNRSWNKRCGAQKAPLFGDSRLRQIEQMPTGFSKITRTITRSENLAVQPPSPI
jgi:hypothetical protein